MHIRFFGQVADLTGVTDLTVDHVPNTEKLLENILKQFPVLEHCTFKLAVNRQIIDRECNLTPTFEVAFLPPFAGG